jgi:uncharacterized RDD family membrane protein YckC
MNDINITTSQNVAINFKLAGVGERLLAQIIDMFIRFIYVFSFYYFLNKFDLNKFIEFENNWSNFAVHILITFPIYVCGLIQESLWDGQTVGKNLLKIRVIKIDGYQASFADYFIRWAFKIVEIMPCFGVIGLIAIGVSKKSQSLGDTAAGTSLISLKNDISINHTILEELQSDFVPTYPLVIKLSDNDVRIIKETYETCMKTRDYATIAKLKNKIIEVTGIVYDDNKNVTFVKTVLLDYNYYTQKM